MKALIIETSKPGVYYVQARVSGKGWENFPGVQDAQSWADLMRKSARVEELEITIRSIICTAKSQVKYENTFAY